MNVCFFLIIAFCLTVFWQIEPARAVDTKVGAKLAEKYKCNGCHDKSRNRRFPPVPFLAGQHQRYLVNQLRAFRDGKAKSSGGFKVAERYNHLMDVPASKLSNKDINNLATFYSAKRCETFGDKELTIEEPKAAKACAFCHGEKGRSPFVYYPKLAGQNMGYLIKQLKLMRASAKHPIEKNARFHRTMAAQVIGLSDAEIVALSYYYSKQTCN
jgi:cytochrome c553